MEEVEEDEEDLVIDNEEEGGVWITPENITKHLLGGDSNNQLVKKAEEDQSTIQHIKFVTSDFAMQNVIIQMGFQILSLDGRRITRVKRFKLLCRSC